MESDTELKDQLIIEESEDNDNEQESIAVIPDMRQIDSQAYDDFTLPSHNSLKLSF